MQQNPYYIIAPSYVGISAGVKLLYILCDKLNAKGFNAYIVLRSIMNDPQPHPFNAPILLEQEAISHINAGLNPITINTDTGFDILKYFPCRVRYLMNYIGIFSNEPKESDPEFQIERKYFWAFSSDIAQRHNVPKEHIMFTPIVDLETFYTPESKTQRNGNICYLGKYFEQFSRILPKEIDDSFYVFRRGGRDMPSRAEYAEKLRHAEMLFVYENTSVTTEALMCGCPVVCVPNPYCGFTEKDMIGLREIGLNGIAIGTIPEEIERAKATVHLAREHIMELIEQYDSKIDFFIEETQKISQETSLDKSRAIKVIKKICSRNNRKLQSKLMREIIRPFKRLKRFLINIMY